MKYTPKKYQKRVGPFIQRNKKAALHIDMGLGKTVAVLTELRTMLRNFQIKSALVVAPLRVATITWPDEIGKWDHLNDLDYVVVRGTPQERSAILREYHEIYIVNYELLDEVLTFCMLRKIKPFDMLVLDESSKLKSHKSGRFKSLKPFVKVNYFNRIIEMTGTPMPEKYQNLWSQYYILDCGRRLMEFVTHFESRYFEKNPHNRFDVKLRPGANLEIQNRIADITLTMLGDEYLDLEPVVLNDIFVELSAKNRRTYKEIIKEYVTTVDDEDIVAVNSAAAHEKCRQIVSGFVYNAEKKALKIHQTKFDALQELIDTVDHNLLVAFHYGFEEDFIRSKWPNAPILGKNTTDSQARKFIDKWNARRVPLMFMHPLSVGHGINLQGGGHNLVFLTLPWAAEAYDQTISRLQRTGQKNPVIVHRIITRDSVDERVAGVLAKKDRTQEDMMRAISGAHEK